MKAFFISLSVLLTGFLVYWFFVRKKDDDTGQEPQSVGIVDINSVFRTSPVNPANTQSSIPTASVDKPMTMDNALNIALSDNFTNNLTVPKKREMRNTLNTGGGKIYGGLRKTVNIG